MMDAAEAPTTPSRDWLATLPSDWNGWQALLAEANASREARNSLRDHLAKRCDPAKDQRALGLGLMAAGQRRSALPHLLQCPDELCRLLAAGVLSALGDHGRAMELWEGLLSSPSLGVRARLGRLESLSARRDVDVMTVDLEALRAGGASPADMAYAEGLLAEAGGDYPGAMASWRVALQHDPEHDEARFRLAFRLDLEGEDDEAIELYRANLESGRPVHVGTLMNLGVLYEDREEYDVATRCFRAVLKDDPTNHRVRRYLADAEASRRQYYDETRERKADMQSAVLRIPVTDFELSVRARNCLQRMNIHTLGDLICRTESELLSFKNFGETSLQEVKEILATRGLRLGMVAPGRQPGQVVQEVLEGVEEAVTSDPDDIRSRPIAELDLSVRSRAALTTLGIANVGQLAETTEATLLSCKNFGQTSLVEIKAKLAELGLSLAG
jgi:DNA-directed RNA polymerase subunit alpha